MATQNPKPDDGDRPEAPKPEVDEEDDFKDEATPALPIEEHPGDQNTG